MRPYRAAIIGCGDIAGGYETGRDGGFIATHMAAYRADPRVVVVACCDPDPAARMRFADAFGVAGRYADAAALLRETRPDVVSVCSPPETHEAVLALCLQGGARGVWCEKPLGLDPANVERLLAQARQRGVAVLVNYPRRYDRLSGEIAAVIASGRFGGLQKVVFHFSRGVMNNAGHAVDLLQAWLGRIEPLGVLRRYESTGLDARLDASLFAPAHPDCGIYLLSNSGAGANFFEYDLLFETARIRSVGNGTGAVRLETGPNPFYRGKRLFADAGEPLASDFGRSMETMLAALLKALEAPAWQALNSLDCLENLKIRHALYCGGSDG